MIYNNIKSTITSLYFYSHNENIKLSINNTLMEDEYFCFEKKTLYFIFNENWFFFLFLFIFFHVECQLKIFNDITCSDYPSYVNRFNKIYNVYSDIYNLRILIKNWISIFLIVNSLNRIYLSSSWVEREVWDLFGIYFFLNFDLRRILNDYGFYGHPFRKDFPITGFYEVSYSYNISSILYDKIRLIQEFRMFETVSPWKFFYN